MRTMASDWHFPVAMESDMDSDMGVDIACLLACYAQGHFMGHFRNFPSLRECCFLKVDKLHGDRTRACGSRERRRSYEEKMRSRLSMIQRARGVVVGA